ncbi:YdcF family protein [Emticicia sp. 17c]|uniref:YdcF family protein n=1 Tax=Emticicia sp. 17c TaxID=3127704 RepID=UPI00301BEC41
MYDIVSKVFTFCIMPAGIICILLIYAITTKNRTKSRKLLITTLIFFYIFSNPFICNEILLLWEPAPTAISAVQPHDVGILLTGGCINTFQEPAENIFLGMSSDRIGQTLQLYKKGKIKKILISGGDVIIAGKPVTSEIDQIAKYLVMSGVPQEDIYLESLSKNTRENATNSALILKKQFPNQKYLLITSAFHLRRAIGCFEKVNVKVTPFGSHYLSSQRRIGLIHFLPWADPMARLQLVLREIVGYISYWIAGWV